MKVNEKFELQNYDWNLERKKSERCSYETKIKIIRGRNKKVYSYQITYFLHEIKETL